MIPNEEPGKAPESTGGRSVLDKIKNALSGVQKKTRRTDALRRDAVEGKSGVSEPIKRIGNADFLADPDGELANTGYMLRTDWSTDTAVSRFWELGGNEADPRMRDWVRCAQTGLLDIELHDGSPSYPGVSEVLLKPSKEPLVDGVRYLPWEENKLTFCRLEPEDRWVFTGPLTGCSIYVATFDDRTYLFHVNSNEDKTAEAKDRKLAAALDGLLSGARVTHALRVDDYRPPGMPKDRAFAAFVYGRSNGGEWDFRYHSVILRIVQEKSKITATIEGKQVAELPAATG